MGVSEQATKTLVFANDRFCSPEEATVSIFDRGFLYGDSVYEVTLTYNSTPFLIGQHLDRLWHSAQGIGLELEFTREELISRVKEGIKVMGIPRQYIRIIITRGAGEIGLDPGLGIKQNLFIIFKELKEYPREWYENGVSLVVTDVMRTPKKAVDPNLKSGNYLNNVLAIKAAREKGAYDAVMLNQDGNVSESTSANIWMVKQGQYITPPIEAGLLGGITRNSLFQIGVKEQLNMKEENFTPEQLKAADEVFMTSSTREVLPVTNIDGKAIGTGKPGTFTQKIHQYYQRFVEDSLH